MRYRNTGAIQFTQEFGLTSYSQVLLQDGLLAGGSAVDHRLGIGNLLFQRLDFGDELFLLRLRRNGHLDIAHYLRIYVGLINGLGGLALGLSLEG